MDEHDRGLVLHGHALHVQPLQVGRCRTGEVVVAQQRKNSAKRNVNQTFQSANPFISHIQ